MNPQTASAQNTLRARIYAGIIDGCMILAPFAVWRYMANEHISGLKLFFLLALFAYHIVFQSGARAATPGKRLFGLKVRHISGRALTFWELFARSFALAIFIPTFVAALSIVASRTQRGLHDKLAESVVE
jgi:uncharacterized RDD family membrane protein YckC